MMKWPPACLEWNTNLNMPHSWWLCLPRTLSGQDLVQCPGSMVRHQTISSTINTAWDQKIIFNRRVAKKAFYTKLPLFKSIKYYANINFIAECWVCSLKSKIWWSEFANKIPILKSEFVKDSIETIFSEYFYRSETYDHIEFLNVLVCFMWGRQNILHSEYMVKFEQSVNAVNCPGFLLTHVNWISLTNLINDEME